MIILQNVKNKVEMEGLEPSSKQGTLELSTCLFQP